MDPQLLPEISQRIANLQAWVLGGLVFIFVLALGLVMFVAWAFSNQFTTQQHLALQGQEAHHGLCALKIDIQKRYTNTARILREQEGSFIFGIPRNLIVSSQSDRKETLAALRVVNCP